MNLKRLLILAGLVALSGQAPRWMAIPSQMSSSSSAALISRLKMIQQSAQAGAPPPAAPPEFHQALQNLPTSSEPMDPDEKRILDDVREVQSAGQMRAPVLEKLIADMQRRQQQARRVSTQAWDGWLAARTWYAGHSADVERWLKAIPGLCVIFGFTALASGRFARARFWGELGRGLARGWIQLMSWGCAALALTAHSNPWPLIPRTLLLIPVLWLGASSVLLNRLDPNYPIWNSTVGNLSAPLLSMVFVVALRYGPSFLSRF